jgi:5,10-methylenetetrahydromethanopterin reductase
MSFTTGVSFQCVDSPDEFCRMVKEVEDLGFDYLWLADSSLHARYVYSYLTLAAVNSKRLKIGTNCTHPHTRHPAVNVNAFITVNEISGGRVNIGVGAGDSPVMELGYHIGRLKEMRQWIEVARRLLAGERFDYDGDYFSLHGAGIHHGLDGVDAPKIYVTASGPKMLALAGELADGVIFHPGAFREGLEFALSNIREGAERAGKSMEDIDVCWQVMGAIDEDRTVAREKARPLAAWFPKRSPHYCQLAGIDDELVTKIRDAYGGGEFHEAQAAIKLTTDEMVDKFVVAGDVDDWRERIEMARALGVNHIELFPLGERMRLVRDVGAAIIG